jgi:hypothetical protein
MVVFKIVLDIPMNINRLLYSVVRICIVLKTRLGREAAGVESNTGFQYNTDEYNIFPYCT